MCGGHVSNQQRTKGAERRAEAAPGNRQDKKEQQKLPVADQPPQASLREHRHRFAPQWFKGHAARRTDDRELSRAVVHREVRRPCLHEAGRRTKPIEANRQAVWRCGSDRVIQPQIDERVVPVHFARRRQRRPRQVLQSRLVRIEGGIAAAGDHPPGRRHRQPAYSRSSPRVPSRPPLPQRATGLHSRAAPGPRVSQSKARHPPECWPAGAPEP